MADLPLLYFPKAELEPPGRRGGGGSPVKTPTPAEQKARLDAKFQALAESFGAAETSAQGMEPEQVIVFETIGASVEGLAKAASLVPGMEWLSELDLDDIDPGDGFEDEAKADQKLGHRLYAVMSNQQAMAQVLALWASWCAAPGARARNNFGPFKTIFVHLKDVRRWGVKDRLADTQVIEYWEQNLRYQRDNVRFEVELWCSGNDASRRSSYEQLRKLVETAGGQCISHAFVAPILYHGVLVDLPGPKIRDTINAILDESYSPLLRCEEVMLFRPLAQSVFPTHPTDGEDSPEAPTNGEVDALPDGSPLVALFDGLPLEHHRLLDGRLVIDDEDNFGALYRPRDQQHGTSMASLIAHGDLGAAGAPITSPIYVRPILRPYENFDQSVVEKTPEDRLLIDLIHRAVRRMKGTATEPGTAPSVTVVNLSFGNSWQPFDRQMSPLARLLDWLAWEYKILFIVSAGNQSQDIELKPDEIDFSKATESEVRATILAAIRHDQMNRRPLSPAEAVNVITVGAVHADASEWDGRDRRVDLLKGARLPSPLSTVANGYNRSVKPDIYFPGGRQLYERGFSRGAETFFTIAASNQPPGLCVAAPGNLPMDLGKTIHTRGTSNATALATRTACLVRARLADLHGEPGAELLTDDYISVVLKTLLVHGASWGEAGELLDEVFGPSVTDWRESMRLKSRFLGYGEVDPSRALFSTDKRVVMLGWDSLKCDQAHTYRVPLPPSLSGRKVKRRLSVSLAWHTPINPRHKDYRRAFLWFKPDKKPLALDKKDLDFESSRRGTVQHQIFEGEKSRAFSDGDDIAIKVSCVEDAGSFTDEIPYALAVTLEIADPIDLKIFNEIQARIRLKVGIKPNP
jgi:Subtilase family